MQRKKFLALMLTVALMGQPAASLPVMAAETETEPLKYLWLKSEDNETFYEIENTDANSTEAEEKEKQVYTGPEYTENPDISENADGEESTDMDGAENADGTENAGDAENTDGVENTEGTENADDSEDIPESQDPAEDKAQSAEENTVDTLEEDTSDTDNTQSKNLNPAEKATDSEEEIFSEGDAKSVSAKSVSFSDAYQGTGEHLAAMAEKNAPAYGALCGEWMVIGLVRSGQPVDSSVYNRYKSGLVDTVKAKKGVLHDKKYTEYSRVVLALTSLGEDVTDVGGYNLLEPLADFDQTIWQGVNGTIWALIAFDSHDYEIPKAPAGKTQTTREKLINDILSQEVSGGGWSLMGGADSDVTGMALQALAPYYKSNSSVKAAVDRAVKKLSSMQLADGTFGTMEKSTSESCSQVVAGLSALGIDCDKDSRFIKNRKSLLQGLLSYYDGSQGFLHVSGNGYDQMATEQAYYAMTAYSRMKNGKTSLYDMTDVAIKSDKEKAEEVKKLIDGLPAEITLSNFETVKAAYAAYNGLNSTQKSVISKSDREKLFSAYEKAQEVEVQYVEKLISKIGKVTLAKENAITDAKMAYNSLSSAQKKKVSNYSVLDAAEKELQRLKKGTSPTPTPAGRPSGKPGSTVNMVTPKPTATPSPEPTAAVNPSKTRTAGGSTKSASVGSGKSSKSSSKTGSSSAADTKNKSTAGTKKKSSNTDTAKSGTSGSETKATSTKASETVIREMKTFFDKKGKNPYPAKAEEYSDKQIRELGKTWKKYEKLSEGEKKAVQKDSAYKSFRKLLTSFSAKYHSDQETGTDLIDNGEDALPWYVKMVVHPEIADESEMETVRKVLGEKSEILSLNEIHFVDTLTGDDWKPEDILKVKLPMADMGDYESCMIVHISDDGKVEFLRGKIADSYITFDAAEFSSYGIAGFMGDSDAILSGQEKSSRPVWPWIAAGGAALLLVVILGGVRIVGVKKKDE